MHLHDFTCSYWFIDSPTHSTHALNHSFIDSMIHFFIDSLVHFFVGYLVHSVRCAWIHHVISLASPPQFAPSWMDLTTSASHCFCIAKKPIGHWFLIANSFFRNFRPSGQALPDMAWIWFEHHYLISPEIFKNCKAWCDFIGYLQGLHLMIFWDCKLRGSVVRWTMIRRPDYGQLFQISMRSVKISRAIVSEMFLMIIQDVEVQDEPE